ncbi:MAG: NADH-quinone oxidoreductase subunit NuoF [Candidatus Delongbacteria bacterium]|nr:NADH-quinone oxidoreductase subunit NuoF [Candidatus Delongbacteria bacterium]
MEYRTHLMVCTGTACVSCGAFDVKKTLEAEIKKQGLDKEVLVVGTGCQGFCAQGPIVVVQPDDIFYQLMQIEDIPFLVEEHFLKGRPVKKMMYTPPGEKTEIPTMSEIGFFNKQRLIALRNKGLIDAEKIDDYIGRDGYKAFIKALTEMTPDEIVQEIKDSGLRGRGGGGFPTGLKWEICKKQKGEKKYIICNADEGDPGAYMDRSIIESDPHAVIEGMLIGAMAIGANEGVVYLRTEYPLAITRLETAIEQAKEYGLLGEDIMEQGFEFNLRIKQGAGAFVCGEETALIASIEGKRGMPNKRPPFPAESGLWGLPTNINNVETWANIPWIISNGSERYAEIGTEKSKGTKVFSLVGKINNTGLVEVPMGITLKEIIFDIGGGVPDGKKFKAVQMGGPSGGCIPAELEDTIIDYDSVNATGAIMGSGGMVVMDETTCMVDVAKYFLNFTQEESCGKCTFCRVGTKRMLEILQRICDGNGEEGDIEKLEELAAQIKDSSLCGLGQTAPNPVLTTLKYFRHEYEAHIYDKKCPAKACKPLLTFGINDQCIGCTACARVCPPKAISGERKEKHVIDQDKCIKCGACLDTCKFKAIDVN